MSSIGGKKRAENSGDYSKRVGLGEVNVILVNPNEEQYKEVLGIELKEDSKAVEYIGESKEGNATIRIDFWLEDVNTAEKNKVTFFLEQKEKENKDQTKKQYINNVGVCSWASDENDLPKWFSGRDYRVAYVGEEELYNFLRTWLGNLDYRDAETVLDLNFKNLLKGKLKDITDQINGEWSVPFVVLYTIKTVIKDDETKEYQSIYNRLFLPSYTLKQFRLVNYNDEAVQSKLRVKAAKDLKIHEKFVVQLTGEYGCKDFFKLSAVEEYNSDDNVVSSESPILDSTDAEY